MTKEEVKAARAFLGMTQRQLAAALGLSATNSKDTVRGWEAGRRAVGGPESVAIRLLVQMREMNPPPPPPPPPPPKPKRPRGRPRIHPIVPDSEKRPRGRPRVRPIADPDAPKRPVGRPRKEEAAE